MPNSMTGFGRAEVSRKDTDVVVEIRSVNNRYLNMKTRLPKRMIRHERSVEDLVRGSVSRGSVEVMVRVRNATAREAPVVDARLAKAYVDSIRKMSSATGLGFEVDLRTVLSLPGVVSLSDSEEDEGREWKLVESGVKKALKDLGQARKAEGGRLHDLLTSELLTMSKVLTGISSRAARTPALFRKRLQKRIDSLLSDGSFEPDSGILEREVAIFADRSDTTEESDRLAIHMSEFKACLARKGPVGRRLDFLIQEMGREANTIGSKNQDIKIGQAVIELKAIVERLREQVQNIE